MTPKQHYLNLAQRALTNYVGAFRAGGFSHPEFIMWLSEGWGGSKARCLYFCLLAAMED